MNHLNEQFFLYNGRLCKATDLVFGIENTSLKYGDGLFETMALTPFGLQNSQLHFDRFFSGMKLLGYHIPDFFSESFFEEKISLVAAKNQLGKYARIRVMAYRTSFGVDYVIEAMPMQHPGEMNNSGIRLGIFTGIRKSGDAFSNLKSNNYLPGILAMQQAQVQQTDDCLILNAWDRICETSIANVFIVKNEKIYTPALSEGCVAGVVRRWLLENYTQFPITETSVSLHDLETADELFLTNSIRLVRWVKSFGKVEYSNHISKEASRFIHRDMVLKG